MSFRPGGNQYISPRTDFGKPPKNYVPGAGRGAVGFTTRSDIGPARQAVVPIDRSISAQKERARQILLQRQLGVPTNNDQPMLPATPSALVSNMNIDKNPPNEDLNDSNYDPFTGYATNLFSIGNYDDEDHEADIIYSTIDKRQDSKRKRRREQREKEQWEEYHRKRPKVHEYFKNEKRLLSSLSLDEWKNIPDAVDLARRKQKFNKRSEKYTPVPDNIIETVSRSNTNNNQIDDIDLKYNGWSTNAPIYKSNTNISGVSTHTGIITTDLTQLGRARDRHLGIQLDKMADNISGQTVVDPKGYLTDLTSFNITSETDVSDIRKARQLLKSVITTNPLHPPGWIAAARLEEAAGKLVAARSIILKGTETCSASQDIWLEASRLHNISSSKIILASAVKCIPKSVKIWLRASKLESSVSNKKAVLRKALEIIPNSIILWKSAIELENSINARIMLSRAVECIPDNIELWIALSKLETYSNAKKVLNRARLACPTDKLVFIESAKLEENNNDKNAHSSIKFIISKGIKILIKLSVVINKEQWFSEAAKCENNKCFLTCREIIFQVYDHINNNNDNQIGDIDDDLLLAKYQKDAAEYLKKKQIHVVRSIYQYILTKYPKNEKIWWDAAKLEIKYNKSDNNSAIATNQNQNNNNKSTNQNNNNNNKLNNLLKKSVENCPNAIHLWLLFAKIQRENGNVLISRSILQKGLEINRTASDPHRSSLYLALCKLEIFCLNYSSAADIMREARIQCNTNKIWLQSVKLIRRISGEGSTELLNLLIIATQKYPLFDKLWLMFIQCYEYNKKYQKCLKICRQSIKYCPNSINLWLEYIRIVAYKIQNYPSARSILQIATLKHNKCDKLWLSAAKLELYLCNTNGTGTNNIIYRNQTGYQQCKSLIASGLQECPNSGLLYAFDIEIEPVQSKKSKCVQSIKKISNSVHILVQVAKYFIQIRKLKRSKDWFERAIINDEKYGDAWVYYYYYTNEKQEKDKLLKRCISANPKYGELWLKISKKIGNENLTTKQILLKVIEKYVKPCNGFPIQVI